MILIATDLFGDLSLEFELLGLTESGPKASDNCYLNGDYLSPLPIEVAPILTYF